MLLKLILLVRAESIILLIRWIFYIWGDRIKTQLVIVGIMLILIAVGLSGCTENEDVGGTDDIITNIYHSPENPTINESVKIYATIKDNSENYVGLMGHSYLDGVNGPIFYSGSINIAGDEYEFSKYLSHYDYFSNVNMEVRYKICIWDYNPDDYGLSYIYGNTLIESSEYSIIIT